MNYSNPAKLSNGMWETIVTNEKGWKKLTVQKRTKKALLQWIKEAQAI